MSRYKYTKLRNLGSVHGFLIHTPDDRQLLDIYPIGIVRELNRMADRIKRLEEAGVELRECASQLGWTSSDDSRWIKRAESAVKAWDKEAKL